MQGLSIASAILILVAPLVHAEPGKLGFALGAKKADGSCKAQADYEADFDAITAVSQVKLVRSYAAADCDFAKNALPAAKNKAFQIVLGIWPDTQVSYDKDRNAIAQYAPQFKDQVWGVSVGSESLYRGNFTGPTLASKMQEVKAQLNNQFRIGTADTWNKYEDGTADAVIQSKPDFLFVNAFAFWQDQDIANATRTYFDDISRAFTNIEKVAGNKDIDLWTGETGWPTADSITFGAAKGGLVNAKTFWSESVCGILAWGYNIFVFEAFDEPWKPKSVGDGGISADETHWGIMTADRKLKFSLSCQPLAVS